MHGGRGQPRSRGGGRGQGRRQGNGPINGAQKQRVFTKLVRDGEATMDNSYQAKRFLEGMETFYSKFELLGVLEEQRNHSLMRIQDFLSFVNSVIDAETLFVPLLKNLLTDETSRPMYIPLRNKVLMSIFMVPEFMSTLLCHEVVSQVCQESAQYICLYLLAISKAFLKARKLMDILELAKALRERGDVSDARPLCSLLLVDEQIEKAELAMLMKPTVANKKVACWVTDVVLPGGRHDNDHRNYRNISVVPTADELCCEARSWLPLASGENEFIDNPTAHLLDRNFWLLCEDISTMKQHISDQKPLWRNARIVDLHITEKRRGNFVTFIVQCDARSGGNPDWARSRALLHGSVVAFCRDGVPEMLGIITVREYESPQEWLHALGGPKIGISFNTKSDFECALNKIQVNGGHQ